jgi:antitoxin CptB
VIALPQSDPELGRLRWRCRRGMRELDRLLSAYLADGYGSSTPAEQEAFRDLLELQDPQLFAYFLGRERPPTTQLAAIVERIASARARS